MALGFRHAALQYGTELHTNHKGARAAAILERLYQTNPFDEEVLRAWLEALYASNQWHKAAAIYRQFQEHLNREVNGTPEAETLRLAQRLRRTDPQPSSVDMLQAIVEPDPSTGLPPASAQEAVPERRRRKHPAPERLVGPVERSRIRYFRGRQALLEQLRQALADDAVRLVQVYGRGGIGRTSLVTKFLLELAEEDAATSATDAFVFVSLRETGGRLPEGVISLLSRTLDAPQAQRMFKVWDSAAPLRNRLEAILEGSLRHHPTVIVFDNLETLLAHDNTVRPEYADLETFIEVCLESTLPLQLIVTTRQPLHFPAELAGRLGARQLELHLDEGLAQHEAVALLRAFDADGSTGVRDADDALLNELVGRCHGVPRLLETLIGTLRQRRT